MNIEHFDGYAPDAPLVTLIEGWALVAPNTYKHRVVYAYLRHQQGRAQRTMFWSGNDERVVTAGSSPAGPPNGDYESDMRRIRGPAARAIASMSAKSGVEYDADEWIPPLRILERGLAARGLLDLQEYVRQRADDVLRRDGILPGLTYVLIPGVEHGAPFAVEAQPKDAFHKRVIGDYVSALGDLHEYTSFLVVYRGTFRPGDPAATQDARGEGDARGSEDGPEQFAVVNVSGRELNGRKFVHAYEKVSDGGTARLGEDLISKTVGPEVAARTSWQGRMVPRFGWDGHQSYQPPG